MNRIFRFMRFIALPCLIFCSCTQSPAPEKTVSVKPAAPAYGDAIVEGAIGEASTMIPLLASDSSSHAVAGLIYNGLVKYDKNFKIVGDLAESFEISPDGLVITFHLRKGVKWHDGAPFTSRDVLYTFKVVIDPKTPTAYAEDFKQVKAISASDDYTVKVSYGSPFAPALASWGWVCFPHIYWRVRTLPGARWQGIRSGPDHIVSRSGLPVKK